MRLQKRSPPGSCSAQASPAFAPAAESRSRQKFPPASSERGAAGCHQPQGGTGRLAPRPFWPMGQAEAVQETVSPSARVLPERSVSPAALPEAWGHCRLGKR